MRFVSLIALGVASLSCASVPALAQTSAAPDLSPSERAALRAADAALQAKDYATAAPAITSAISAAGSGYARYLATSLQLRLAEETNNRSLQAQAIEGMISSGAAPPAALEELYKNQGALALTAGDTKRAEGAFDHWAEIAPNNPDVLLALAEVKDDRGKMADSVSLIVRAIDQQQAAGKPVPESWYKRGLKQAFDAGLAEPSMRLAQGLVRAYPTPENWRDAVLIYRDLYHPEAAANLDAYRLMRSTQALSGERDYLEYAQALDGDRNAGERKAVLEEGVTAKMVDPAKPAFKAMITATGKPAAAGKSALAGLQTKAGADATGAAALTAGDAYFGYGDYAKAADLYRGAIAKGSIDVNVANMRLGMALAMAGQRAEAEAALRAVTGPRQALASYWLVWLGQRQAA